MDERRVQSYTYYSLVCRSRARQGVLFPSWGWRAMLEWWAWRFLFRHPIQFWRWVRRSDG